MLEAGFPRSPWFDLGGDLALDMYETDKDVVVQIALPGLKPEDVEISVVGDILTIKGEIKAEEDVEERNYIRRERCYGSFSRSITLPGHLDTENAEAEFDNGVLKLTVPKSEDVKPKAIKVKTK
ncbi:MAG: hypothetical protein A2Y73_01880 [Chloroflexi bacterium RBG_13_56_8]|nr:MAG: hypothetical protein A2Y73_01880 [Chloroflexi bacterium RBG_13_56_8]